MSFSFGSFGDILALANLACKIAKALSDSRGSSAEYQELILELHSLSTALEGLHRYLFNRGPKRLEYSAENAINFALLTCRTLMTDFSEKIRGYQTCLQRGGSGNRLRDSWRKIGWGIFKREEVVDLKKKLMEQKVTINMMLALSNCSALDKIEQLSHEQRNAITQLPEVLGQQGQGFDKVLEEYARQNAEQRELLSLVQNSLRADLTKQHEETINYVRATAQESVPFNIQGYLDEFSKAMAMEMRMLLGEMERLQEKKRALLQEVMEIERLRDLTLGGERELSEPAWPTITQGSRRGEASDGEWEASDARPQKPSWRTVAPRSSRQKKKKTSDPFMTVPVASSWATWQPDTALVSIPPSTEPLPRVPGNLRPFDALSIHR